MKKSSDEQTFSGKVKTWLHRRKEIVRFFLFFGLALVLFSWILEQDVVQQTFVLPHLGHVASVCGKAVNLLGTESQVSETSIISSRFSVNVVKGCESIYPTAMLWAALLAFPASWKWKIVGLIAGAVILYLMNIVRVVTMFYIGMYFPTLFDMVHVYAWQALFILLTLTVWLLWAARVSRLKT